jgi:hypothetical protein
MCIPTYKVGLLFSLLLTVAPASPRDLDAYKKTCADIGFTKGTPAYGSCVLELDRRALSSKNIHEAAPQPIPTPEHVTVPDRPSVPQGDGSSDDVGCRHFGFTVGSSGYADCRYNLAARRADADARQARYEEEKRQYEQQVEDAKEQRRKEKQQKCAAALAVYGTLQACGAAASGLPVPTPPTPPQIGNFIINTPRGTTMCNYAGNVLNCN